MLPQAIFPQEIPVLVPLAKAAYALLHVISNDKVIPKNGHHGENLVSVVAPDLNNNQFGSETTEVHTFQCVYLIAFNIQTPQINFRHIQIIQE
jgi:hypothetical protein